MGTLGGIPLDVGDVLAKKYRLERLVGEGGTGVVVAARHLQLDRLVAIKFLRTALASDEIRTRFEREARAIGQIESEHVVLVLDVGALDDYSPYMVMEYLEGRDLAKVLKEDGTLSIEDTVDCMLQVCEALEQAHESGIIHRDLKPANLFLTRREDGGPHIKVVDFGISKILDPKLMGDGPSEMTLAFTVLGSPRYMAPEQVRNSKDVDGRADLWSLGAVMFQLITGKPAFDAENNVHVSLAVMTTEPPLLRQLAPQAPAALEAIVNKCLTKDRNGRFQTAAELADALRPLASERTRDSLERMQEAKEAPHVSIGLGVRSVGERVDRSAVADAAASARELGRDDADPAPPALRQVSTVPTGFRAAGPLLEAPAPSSGPQALAFARAAVRRPPTPGMKVAIAMAGVLVVLLAFGVLTVLKRAAQSMGMLKAATAQASPSTLPASAGAASAHADLGPSQAVTVTLDAGHAPR
ncbi:MAG TPA: serine/threonine-protein kinase [Labilithrix sp.]|nr:serine/threonine-protein kinase [Labilithrix sp.]